VLRVHQATSGSVQAGLAGRVRGGAPLRRNASDAQIFDWSRGRAARARDTEAMMRQAILAAGVPLDRVAGINADAHMPAAPSLGGGKHRLSISHGDDLLDAATAADCGGAGGRGAGDGDSAHAHGNALQHRGRERFCTEDSVFSHVSGSQQASPRRPPGERALVRRPSAAAAAASTHTGNSRAAPTAAAHASTWTSCSSVHAHTRRAPSEPAHCRNAGDRPSLLASVPAHVRAGVGRLLPAGWPYTLWFGAASPRTLSGSPVANGAAAATPVAGVGASGAAGMPHAEPGAGVTTLAAAASAALDAELQRQRALANAASPASAARDFTSAALWRPVLRECLSVVEREYHDVCALRNLQINTGFLLILVSIVLMIASVQWASTPAQVVAGVAQTAAITFGAALAFSTLIHVEQRATAFAWLSALSAAGLAMGASVTWFFGLPAWGISTALGLLTWAALQLWVAFMSTTTEVRGFKRAVYQVRILLQRPPAVVA
jgi:hypothetical protein